MRIIRKSPIHSSRLQVSKDNLDQKIERNLQFFQENGVESVVYQVLPKERRNAFHVFKNKFSKHFYVGKIFFPQFFQQHRYLLGITIATIIAASVFTIKQLNAVQTTQLFFTPASQSITVSHAGSTTIQAEIEAEKQIVGIQVFANVSGTIPDTLTLTPYAVSGMDLILNQIETTSSGKVLKMVFLVPPTSTFLTVSETLTLAELGVIANQPGQMTITFDPTLTKILEYQTSTNLISQLSAGSMTFLSPTPTPTPRPSNTPVPTATNTPTATPEPTITNSPTPTATNQPQPTATFTPEPTITPTSTPTQIPTLTPTSTPTIVPTATPSPTPEITSTPTPTIEPTTAPTATPSQQPTPTETPVPTTTPTSTPEPTNTPAPTATTIPTLTPTTTPSVTPEPTVTNSPTPNPTNQPQPTDTPTPGPTSTPTFTPTSTPVRLLLDSEPEGNILGIFNTDSLDNSVTKPTKTPQPTQGVIQGVMTEDEVVCENQPVGLTMILGALFLLLLLTHIYLLPEFSFSQVGASLLTIFASTILLGILDCDHRTLFWFFISLMVLGGEFILKWVVEMLIGE